MPLRRLHVLFVFALGVAAALSWRDRAPAGTALPVRSESMPAGPPPASVPPPIFADRACAPLG